MSTAKKPQDSANSWYAPATITLLIIGSGFSLWLQSMGISGAFSTLPVSSGGSTITHLSTFVAISPSIGAPSIVHRAAPIQSTAAHSSVPAAHIVKLEIGSPTGRLISRMTVGQQITLQARGWYSDAPTVSKPVKALWTINGAPLTDCSRTTDCVFHPLKSGSVTLGIKADNNATTSVIMRVLFPIKSDPIVLH